MKHFAIALVLAVAVRETACAESQTNDASTTAQKLTGGSARDWIFAQIHRTMGTSDGCTQGEVYRFSADRTLTIEKCVNGTIERANHRWTVSSESQLDTLLTIDAGETYTLLFKDEATTHLMRLRTRSGSKTSPTVDRDFRLSDD